MKILSFRKVTAVMIMFGLVLGIAACSQKHPYKEESDAVITSYEDCKVSLTVEVTGTREITVNLENMSEYTYMYGHLYSMEYKDGDTWYKVPFNKGAGVFTMEGIALGPAEEFAEKNPDGLTLDNTGSEKVVLDGFGRLPEGHYRILKEIYVTDEESDIRSFWIAAEFDLEKE
jgi:hypothetical protein